MPEASETPERNFIGGDVSTELSANRTAMSFERTAMSAHRTLQSVMKTALSLIGFGFTIFKFFAALNEEYLARDLARATARNFGLAMIVLGILILILGILDHYRAMKALRERKHRLVDLGIVHSDMPSRIASSMAVALALLLLGVMAIANIVFGLG